MSMSNLPYQVNYFAKRFGKNITVTKRRITFQFGFIPSAAITAGKTDIDCRGEEHEVVLIWSHLSGKRQVFMDGKEIHVSQATGYSGCTKFHFSWTLDEHVLKLEANVKPVNANSDFRQFDLLLDGRSYFDFQKLYQRNNHAMKTFSNDSHDGDYYDGIGCMEEQRDDEEEYEDETSSFSPKTSSSYIDNNSPTSKDQPLGLCHSTNNFNSKSRDTSSLVSCFEYSSHIHSTDSMMLNKNGTASHLSNVFQKLKLHSFSGSSRSSSVVSDDYMVQDDFIHPSEPNLPSVALHSKNNCSDMKMRKPELQKQASLSGIKLEAEYCKSSAIQKLVPLFKRISSKEVGVQEGATFRFDKKDFSDDISFDYQLMDDTAHSYIL